MADEEDMDRDLVILDERREGKKKKSVRRSPQNFAKKANEKINGLACFPEVDRMIRRGVFARKVAEYIQDTAKELKGQSLESVTRAVKRYRESLEKAGVSVDVDSGGRSAPDDDDPIHELRVMQEMFNVQRKRIDMEVMTETTLKKLFSTTHDEFEVLSHMGVSILKLKKTFGIVGKESNRSRIGGNFSGRVDIAKIAQNPESRHKVLKLTETLMSDPELMDDIIEHGGVEGLEKEMAREQTLEEPEKEAKKKIKKVVKKKKIIRRRKKTTKKK